MKTCRGRREFAAASGPALNGFLNCFYLRLFAAKSLCLFFVWFVSFVVLLWLRPQVGLRFIRG